MNTCDLKNEELDIIAKLLLRELKENGAFTHFKKRNNLASYKKLCNEIRRRNTIYHATIDLLWAVCQAVYVYKHHASDVLNIDLRSNLFSSNVVIKFYLTLMGNKSLFHLHEDLIDYVNNEFNYICYTLFPDNHLDSQRVTLSKLKNVCGEDIISNLREHYIKLKSIIRLKNRIKCLG